MNSVVKTVEIVICMGSSCFSRGNNWTLEVLREYISRNNLTDRIKITGSLCEGRCKQGPNLTIDGVQYEQVNRTTIVDILEYHLREDTGD